MYNNNTANINFGDSVEVDVYGHICRGFILNHFITTRAIGSNEPKILSWFLVNDKNELICVATENTMKTSRIVLTEKTKCPTKVNQEFFDRAMDAQRVLKQWEHIQKSRRTGSLFAFSQHSIYKNLFDKEKSALTTIPQVKISFFAGKSE